VTNQITRITAGECRMTSLDPRPNPRLGSGVQTRMTSPQLQCNDVILSDSIV